MAQALVFVDDAVQGDPLGWLGLLILSVARSGRSEVLVIQVPYSEPAYQRLRDARRLRRVATAASRIDLDASRRWVTLNDVHPSFAAAHQAQPKHQRA